jgi:hypothetical protein
MGVTTPSSILPLARGRKFLEKVSCNKPLRERANAADDPETRSGPRHGKIASIPS